MADESDRITQFEASQARLDRRLTALEGRVGHINTRLDRYFGAEDQPPNLDYHGMPRGTWRPVTAALDGVVAVARERVKARLFHLLSQWKAGTFRDGDELIAVAYELERALYYQAESLAEYKDLNTLPRRIAEARAVKEGGAAGAAAPVAMGRPVARHGGGGGGGAEK